MAADIFCETASPSPPSKKTLKMFFISTGLHVIMFFNFVRYNPQVFINLKDDHDWIDSLLR